MTRDEIVEFSARRQEGFNRLDSVMLAGLHAEEGVVETPFGGGVTVGREAIEQVYRAFFTAFSTVRFDQEMLLIDGHKTALLVNVHGTNSGEVMGVPPSDRPFRISMVSLCELRDGFIVQERRIYDFTGLLLQVGALKAKPI
jgi:predicted ester cyclase